MSHKWPVLVLPLLVVLSSTLLSQGKPEKKVTGADERIRISVDKVERSDQFSTLSGAKVSPPVQGNDYVVVHLSIEYKQDLGVAPSELRLADPTCPQLVDDLGKAYGAGIGDFNITAAKGPFGEGGRFLFQMPTQARPVQLRFIYPYRDDSERTKEIKYGRIDIDLSQDRPAKR